MIGKGFCIDDASTYRMGDPAPNGYLAWHEWAEAQHKAGLRQTTCPACGKWRFPSQYSEVVDRCAVGQTADEIAAGVPMRYEDRPVCLDCVDSRQPHD